MIVPFSILGQSSDTYSFDSTAYFYANRIDTNRIKNHLEILASDSLEGRRTGTKGQRMAADYIKNYFASLGLKSATGMDSLEDYSQKVTLFAYTNSNSKIIIDKDTLEPFIDYYSSDILSDTILKATGFVFLGYGIDSDIYSNYPNKDISGKIGVIVSSEPMKGDTYLLSGTIKKSVWSESFIAKYNAAVEHGLTAIIIVNIQFENSLQYIKPYLELEQLEEERIPNFNIPRVVVSPKFWELIFPKSSFVQIMEDLDNGKVNFNLHAEQKSSIIYTQNGIQKETENVYGFIQGAKLPNEYVFITAHYDHLGMDSEGNIYNGADDNGSGTSTVMELARVFKTAAENGHRPNRSVVFMLMTGEEEGLLGSSYYSENPIFPLDSTITDLNIDMIGRTDDAHLDDSVKYIYPIGAEMISKDLNQILENVNTTYTHFNLDYKFDDPNDPQRLYYRSDHYNFARHGIPVIFFFRGLHDDYHKPTDTMDKIEYDTIDSIANLVFYTAWEVANRVRKLEKEGADFR